MFRIKMSTRKDRKERRCCHLTASLSWRVLCSSELAKLALSYSTWYASALRPPALLCASYHAARYSEVNKRDTKYEYTENQLFISFQEQLRRINAPALNKQVLWLRKQYPNQYLESGSIAVTWQWDPGHTTSVGKLNSSRARQKACNAGFFSGVMT